LEDANMMELLAALSGAGIVIGRMLNAQAGARIGLLRSTFNNYWVGLVCCAAFLALAGGRIERPEGFEPIMYLGGALGVGVVMLSSLVALRVSTLRLTLVAFVSQMMTALALDWAFSGVFSAPRAIGSLLVLAGLVVLSPGGDASATEKNV
jgi:transporter family-2 protein